MMQKMDAQIFFSSKDADRGVAALVARGFSVKIIEIVGDAPDDVCVEVESASDDVHQFIHQVECIVEPFGGLVWEAGDDVNRFVVKLERTDLPVARS